MEEKEGCMKQGCRWTCLTFLIIVILLIYILSPIDIAPELALGPAGFIDDAIALVAGIIAEGVISIPALKQLFKKK